MTIDTPFGFILQMLPDFSRLDRKLWGEHAGWVLLEIEPKNQEALQALGQSCGINQIWLGQVLAAKADSSVLGKKVDVLAWEQAYRQNLPNLIH
jgi:hypothetical protein